jgi:hypothetical protein
MRALAGSGPEAEAGEHVRQNATKVQIFSVTSGS